MKSVPQSGRVGVVVWVGIAVKVASVWGLGSRSW